MTQFLKKLTVELQYDPGILLSEKRGYFKDFIEMEFIDQFILVQIMFISNFSED